MTLRDVERRIKTEIKSSIADRQLHLFTEISRVVYDDNETAPEMSYKERALTAESNFHHTSRVVSGGNGGVINIKPSGESGAVFTHKSRVVDGDDSGIE